MTASWNLREATVTYQRGVRTAVPRTLRSSRDIATLVQHAPDSSALSLLTRSPVERFVVLGLDARHRVIAYTQVGIGGTSGVHVDAAAVFRFLLASCAHACVLVHNHPSGEVKASCDDIAMTERLQRAADLLGIQLLDHLIVTDTPEYFSFLDAGLL